MTRHSLVILCCYLYTLFDMAALHFPESDLEEYGRKEASLSLRDILPLNPKQYDKHRAPKFLGQPTIVYFHVTVLSLDSINEESMTYVADIFLAQSWRDSRLRLPENMSEEYRILDVDWLHNIWRPDCFFKNAKKVTFHEMSIPNHYLWLYHDKTLLYMSKLTLVLSCAMKFESYPHDTQICSMMIESCTYYSRYSIVAHHPGPGVHLEHDGPAGGEPGDRAAAAGHLEQLHDRLHDRILHGELHLHTDRLQSPSPPGLSPVPHLHTVRPDRGHVLDRVLDQTRGNPRAGHPRRDVTADPRDTEHAVPAITATGLLREGHRRLDVLVQRVRLPLADGVRRGEQLHGARGHQGDEGLLGRGSQGGHRRVQDADEERVREEQESRQASDRAIRHLLPGAGDGDLHRQVLQILLPVLFPHPERRLLEHLPVRGSSLTEKKIDENKDRNRPRLPPC